MGQCCWFFVAIPRDFVSFVETERRVCWRLLFTCPGRNGARLRGTAARLGRNDARLSGTVLLVFVAIPGDLLHFLENEGRVCWRSSFACAGESAAHAGSNPARLRGTAARFVLGKVLMVCCCN